MGNSSSKKGIDDLKIGEFLVIRHGLLKMPNNVFVVKGKDEKLILIDTGFDQKDFQRMTNIFKDYKFSFIIITHVHLDHTGNLEKLMKLPQFKDSKIILHEYAKKNLINGKQILQKIPGDCWSSLLSLFAKENIPAYKNEKDLVSFPFNEDKKDEKDIKLQLKNDFNLEILHSPGHTPGCISIWNEKTRNIIIGDLINREVLGNGVRLPFEVTSFTNLYKSYNDIVNLNPQRIYASHYDGHVTKEKIIESFPKAFENKKEKGNCTVKKTKYVING